ncbi:MAG TPA: M14 family zinc carboxypeptidase [Jiangellaceae bacterium]|nr:M14 family zinc carboxypeptidase [Jiangellaceae bacterium]
MNTEKRRRLGGRAGVVALTVALLIGTATAVASTPSQAQEAGEVTALAVAQGDGFATLSWTPVEGATDYQIERTSVNAANEPIGPERIVGLWQPTRTVMPESPTFADSGFVLGERFRWRVRARIGTEPLPFSEPVFGTTRPQFGDPSVAGENLRTQFELTNGAQFTSDVNEFAYTAALDEASDRVRVVEIGRTLLGRPINMMVFGYPKPLPTAAAISSHPSVLIQCHVHGNEPSMRESCMIFARELAFTDDPELINIMSRTTVLLVITLNGDGRAANTRGSSTGQDLNRDHSLLREPETKALSAMLRDYTPDIGVDGHNGDSEDLPVLGPRHLNVYEGLYAETKNGLIESWLYDSGALDGWYVGPYSNGGASQETILRNTFGLKNVIGLLSENRSAAGLTRPNATAAENQNRRSYGQMWLIRKVLEYHRDNLPLIQDTITESIAFQKSNEGPIVFRGSYPWPLFPPLPSAPDVDAPAPGAILEEPPCGYFLTEEQYSGPHPQGTAAERLELHGIEVVHAPARDDLGRGYLVLMEQPLRGLIPLLLDGQAAEPMVDGIRLFSPTTPDGEPLPDAGCGRGPAVQTADIDVDYDLDYTTDE